MEHKAVLLNGICIVKNPFEYITLSSCYLFSISSVLPAAGVDPPHHTLAGEPNPGEDHGSDAEEAGGLPGLQAPAQAAQGAGEVPAGNQLQHAADQAAHQQSARLHALRGEDGFCESIVPTVSHPVPCIVLASGSVVACA